MEHNLKDNPSIFIKNLFGGWVVIDNCLVKQTTADTPKKLKEELRSGLKNCITWESFPMPEEFCQDLKKYYANILK